MMLVLHLASTLAVVVVTATTLAHALEMPGKLRLPRDKYLAVQRIYYPGFTVVGAAELPTVLALAGSALATSTDGPAADLRWAAATLAALAHAVYWLVVHPTNRQWLRDDDRVDAASSGSSPSRPPRGTGLGTDAAGNAATCCGACSCFRRRHLP